jgi:hypothetical protein
MSIQRDHDTPPTRRADCPVSGLGRADQRHRRLFGVWRNPAVQQEIASLDAVQDCQRIVHLLTTYEFPADMQRSTELALFHTYGSTTISALLDRTQQFSRHGQKRYDDTRLLIARFIECGWDGEMGHRAIEQMNHIHAFYRIENEDFLFVLWTFLDFPMRWLESYGWRSFTAHEREAWFQYWTEIGRRMHLKHIPTTWADFDAFVSDYESRKLTYAPANARVAQATLDILASWLPRPLRFAVPAVVACLVPERLLPAVGMKPPSPVLKSLIQVALKARARVKRWLPYERYPTLLMHTVNRTYPGHAYRIEALGPLFAHRESPPERTGDSPP